ncbi:MAG: DHA2 family efflux MFS transporter permease subunit [Candidatus Eremiobacteraeota bacterium]|nr:DHA2 family efflux MFS transporter permease subunit [Candidatus Eremiobacteraeota bacterium]MBV9057382.1 DHA2 family efflux MFS transporter permease subunit [Candidatus Eremiobacteraeota bacterium]MBV9700930.1 DHA2 family efflux MFS transporter permease subunit [Candidatus Eremiobacteraeota bacterium]
MSVAERAVRVGVIPARPRPQLKPVSPHVKAPAAPPSLVQYGTRRWLVTAGVMLAALLQTIDLTIVNVALPTVQGNLGATVDSATWVLTGYVIANVVVIPMTPWLQLRFGRKNYFLVSIAGFTLASVLCGVATSLSALILFRIIQGAFGGGLLAVAQVVLRETFPPEQLGLSQSIFALGTILGPSIGPTLGGILVDNFSWPWVFDVNVVPGIVAFLLLWRYMRDNGAPRKVPMDVTGIALLLVAVSCMQYVLDQGQHDDWFSDQSIQMCTFLALVATATFVWWELRVAQPIVDLRMLRHPAVTAALAIAGALAGVVFPALLLLPQFTVEDLGFTSTLAGILIGIRALPVLLLTLPVARLTSIPRFDLRWLIGGGLAVAGFGLLWLASSVTTQSDLGTFTLPLLVIGTGSAFVYSPLLVATMRAVTPDAAPKASSFIVLAFQLGGSISSAGIVAFFDRREQFHQTILAAATSFQRLPVMQFLQHGTPPQLAEAVAAQAAALSYADTFLVTGVLALLAAPSVLLLARKRT